MATSRYSRTPVLSFGSQFGSNQTVPNVRAALKNGTLNKGKQIILRGDQRLDTLAGIYYGEAQYWWVIAAASNIAWGLQVPAGTILYLPDINDILALLGS